MKLKILILCVGIAIGVIIGVFVWRDDVVAAAAQKFPGLCTIRGVPKTPVVACDQTTTTGQQNVKLLNACCAEADKNATALATKAPAQTTQSTVVQTAACTPAQKKLGRCK